MKKLINISCLTIAVLLGSSSVSYAEGIWFPIKENPKCSVWNQNPEYYDESSETASWDGVCLNGRANGKGKLIWRFKKDTIWEEQIFVGEYKDGKENGQGTITFANGNKYVGEFKNDKMNGPGTFTEANGNKYVGEYKDNKKHGPGTYTFAVGGKYAGEWKDDKRNGQGTQVNVDGDWVGGIWENDKLK
jgi:hypothetical protein